MIEEALDPRPAPECFARMIGANADVIDALRLDPGSLARNWNDRESAWGNLRDFRHWIERARP
jgi:hypothetical protein